MPEPADVTIKLQKIKGLGKSFGTLDYKDKPAYRFRTAVQNGYWKHYYVISELSSDDSKKNVDATKQMLRRKDVRWRVQHIKH